MTDGHPKSGMTDGGWKVQMHHYPLARLFFNSQHCDEHGPPVLWGVNEVIILAAAAFRHG